jgi:hypothetical protein
MYFTIDDGTTDITKKLEGETWPEVLESFLYALQGLGYCFKFTPDKMVNMLENAIDDAIEKVK